MNTAHKAFLLCLLAFGCSVPLSADLDLDIFDKDPDFVDVSTGPKTVACDMTITPSGGRTVKHAACSFVSPGGRKAGCLATSSVGNLWSCDATIPADTEDNTWTIEYVFAEDDLGAKLFATGAELVADAANVLEGDATRVDLDVQSPTEDTDPPSITNFTALPATVLPGGTVTCTITATDASPWKDSGCTFLPDDSSPSVSCLSHGGLTCDIDIPGTADAGVTFTEVNHFARDEALNVTVGNLSRSFDIGGSVPLDFWSDWRTATGTSSNAYLDGGKWLGSAWSLGNEVIPAAGLGFPAGMTNVFVGPNIDETGEGGSVSVWDLWPTPAVGEAVAFRVYVRHNLKNPGGDIGNPSNHPIQAGVGSIAYAWSWKWGLRANDDVSNFQFTGLNDNVYMDELPAEYPKGTVFCVEWSWERVTTSTYRARTKVTDADDYNNVYGEDDTVTADFTDLHIELQNSTDPSGNTAPIRALFVGWPGGAGWQNVTGDNTWGGVAVAITEPGEWIGPYPTADEE